MTTLEQLRKKYISFNPKKDVYTFTITGMQENQLRKLLDDLYNVFDKIDTSHVTFNISNPNPIGYIECHLN